ncbi:MAG: fumarylacetoacetate hydrolase family protein [Chloroflexota bacterium]|nr:fumarylacetoacetate hydrolase family protein [Chloroflexota bacterium]
MRIGHVRERHAPSGSAWRLAAALPDGRWLLLEEARAWLAADHAGRAHNEGLLRAPITTLDTFLRERRGRIEALAALVEPFRDRPDALEPSDEGGAIALELADIRFGPPILEPPTLRDFYVFEQHVGTVWKRRGGEIPEAWYRMPIFYFSNTSEIRGPDDPIAAPPGCEELDYELEVAAVIDTPAVDLSPERGDEAIGGYTIFNDWSARDLQREETTVRLGPAKGKDFASTIGPWIVTPDELADARAGKGYELVMTATVNGEQTSRGTWSSARYSFGEMVARASAAVRLRPGDVIGSGTVGTGCLLEVRDDTIGRYLQPGDVVTLAIERIGELTNPVVARPEGRQ